MLTRWDGSSWIALGQGVDEAVLEIAFSGTDLYVGGQFFASGSLGAATILPGVARWNGSTWSALGRGVTGIGSYSNPVRALVTDAGHVYAGDLFFNAGSKASGSFAIWMSEAAPASDHFIYLPLLVRLVVLL